MTLTFEFKDGNRSFSCPLQCQRCEARNTTGRQCKRRVCIGVPYCWLHLEKKEHIKIKDAGDLGKGVFAWDSSKPANTIIFRKGDKITRYNGEKVTENAIDRRYRDKTGPYAILRGRLAEDGACKRGTGTLFNHKSRGNQADLTRNNDHFFVKANRTIKNKDQIFVNYGTQDGPEHRRYKMDEGTIYFTKRKSSYRRRNR